MFVKVVLLIVGVLFILIGSALVVAIAGPLLGWINDEGSLRLVLAAASSLFLLLVLVAVHGALFHSPYYSLYANTSRFLFLSSFATVAGGLLYAVSIKAELREANVEGDGVAMSSELGVDDIAENGAMIDATIDPSQLAWSSVVACGLLATAGCFVLRNTPKEWRRNP